MLVLVLQLCTAVPGAGWCWSPFLCTIGIFGRKSIFGAYGLLFAIGRLQSLCCTWWIWLTHNPFCQFSSCEEFCTLREFISYTDRSGHRYITVRGHACASFLSNRLHQIWEQNSCWLCPQGWLWDLAPHWLKMCKSLGAARAGTGAELSPGYKSSWKVESAARADC